MASCQLLAWDTAFFGLTIGRLEANEFRATDVPYVLDWCRRERVDCLYFLADIEDAEAIRTAETAAFRLVDVRVMCEGRLAEHPPWTAADPAVRPYAATDLASLRPIAREAFVDQTRFFTDPNIPRDRAIDLYDTWIVRSCEGAADRVLVAEVNGTVGGFITCHLDSGLTGRIGLTAVAGSQQGSGLGLQLVESAAEWFRAEGASTVSVVTQGRNIRAQRLYQRCGLRTRSIHLWFHYWPKGNASS
jgi:dTDP-4-amino-4,6-dideoxy-D-galactose acyltransferase